MSPAGEETKEVTVESVATMEHLTVIEQEFIRGSEVISEPGTASEHKADLP